MEDELLDSSQWFFFTLDTEQDPTPTPPPTLTLTSLYMCPGLRAAANRRVAQYLEATEQRGHVVIHSRILILNLFGASSYAVLNANQKFLARFYLAQGRTWINKFPQQAIFSRACKKVVNKEDIENRRIAACSACHGLYNDAIFARVLTHFNDKLFDDGFFFESDDEC